MAEIVQVYHDKEQRHRSTFHTYEDVRGLVRTIIEDDAHILIVRDGKREKRFVLDTEKGHGS